MEHTTVVQLATILTLIIMTFIIIGIPWLAGLAIDRLFNITITDRDHLATWFIGAMGLIAIGLIASGIYLAYTDIFTYYIKH